MRKVISKAMLLAILLTVILPGTAFADDWFEPSPGYYTLLDEKGGELTVMAREISVDDEYVSGDNKHYIVTRVDRQKREAYTRLEGEITLPAAGKNHAITAAQQDDEGSILLYCTHNSESYVPSDGRESIEGKGGIKDVARAFEENLKEKGIKAVFSDEVHDPHDAGAYRRSRQTAVRLIKENMPVKAVFDIHRDAVPKSHYVTEVKGEDMTKVRIVIGRRNQNRKANEELAYKIKAVADDSYPGLIKDIFIGKGSYNQELSPRSLLFEMGTHENTKEAAQKSTAYLADVVSRSLFGGRTEDQAGDKKDKDAEETRKDEKREDGRRTGISRINRETGQDNDAGGGRGLTWLLVVVVAGVVGFLLISMGGKELSSKFRGSSRQEYSSFLGRKKKKK
ncbi:MAG TPA: stage II sporulation protein P [Clostridiales bacterium]|jgi:stage II sporulation protein P|nr:stage II sporulation protein P [Clostridiales bacterium]